MAWHGALEHGENSVFARIWRKVVAWVFSSRGGGGSKLAALQVKHCYQVSDEIGSFAIFLIFLLIFFDTRPGAGLDLDI